MAPVQIMVTGFEGKTTMVNLPNLHIHTFAGFGKMMPNVGLFDFRSAPIDQIFDQYVEKTGIPMEGLRIIYGTKDLRRGEGKTLEDYGMGNLSNVFAVARVRGGINPLQLLRCKKQELMELPGMIKVTTSEACMITLDDDPYSRRAKMPCGHVISPIGMTQYCKSLLDEKRFTFPCPYMGVHGDRCTATWEFLLVKYVAVLDQSELSTIERKLNENYARRSIGVQQCPGCQTYCMRTSSRDAVVRCEVCTKKEGKGYDFCWSCLQRSSSYNSCKNPRCDGRDPRLLFLQVCPKKKVVEVPNCPSVRACVNCGILIEHTEACKHMTCIACKAEFCFICLKKREGGKWKCGSYNSPCTPAPVQTSIHGQ